ncbi:hypothetical protein L9F63_021109 [Diploptera punctata]|uniref:Uncharacterized protein n=1 Tax=Diploptera punctata TaxID=6984 RepID=A0AAD7ZQ87_DIPPU|nr:hypothetical protein L9F63_021109 [Diploptera punctata]
MREFNIPVQLTLNHVLDADISHFCTGTGEGTATDVDELRKNFRAVQEENNKLQAVITDVTEVNKQWQKYNNDRQLYVQYLLSTIQDQEEKINNVVEKRAGVLPTLAQEDELKVENSRLQEEVARLKEQLEQKDRQYREHVEVLQFQVKSHHDDWEAERNEKQQLQLQIKQLEKHVIELKMREQHCELCCGCEIDNKHLPKTYRTSVHLPCTSARLQKQECTDSKSDKKITRSKSCTMEDEQRYSCSVVHISPTASGSSISGDSVTIGFNSSGLASVTSFSEHPVVKSSSDTDANFKWSIARPPVSDDKIKVRSSSNSEVNVRKTSVPWKAKYFEEGIATQTKEDVICPGCGQIFPPNLQIEFLDHFEVCQKCEKKKFSKPKN